MAEKAITSSVHSTVQVCNRILIIICLALLITAFVIRVYVRVNHSNGFRREDWACLASWVLGVAYHVLGLIMGHFGGRHNVDVSSERFKSFQKATYAAMILYGPTVLATKVCLLWIMARVFNPLRNYVRFIYTFMGTMTFYYIILVIVKVWACDPVKGSWDDTIERKCVDIRKVIVADAIVSVISDMIVLILPFCLVSRLSMPKSKKLSIIGIMGAGGLAVIATITRLVLIVVLSTSNDITIAALGANLLAIIEIAIGIVCGCLPMIASLVTSAHNKHIGKHRVEDDRLAQHSGKKGDSIKMNAVQKRFHPYEGIWNPGERTRFDTTISGGTGRKSDNKNFKNGRLEIIRTVDIEVGG